MKTVEVKTEGSVQSISLPQDCHVEGERVFVKRVGRAVLLIPNDTDPWLMFTQSLVEFTDDFMQDRSQPEPQDRGMEIE
jgi:antitoxin VapB